MFPNNNKGFFQDDVEIIKQAMIITSLRGSDSTGIAAIEDADKKPKIFKTVGDPFHLLHNEGWTKLENFLEHKAKVAFGHGRAATKGAVTAKNAHPFVHEHITLVHNGTIHYGLGDHAKDTEVDSHALCIAIAKEGLKEALRSVYYGAYALIVHDAQEKCIYLVRNEERPLHWLRLPSKRIVLSEESALRFINTRNKLTYQDPVIEYLPANVIWKYDIETAEWTTDEELKKEITAKKALPSPKPTTTGSANGGTRDVYIGGGLDLMLVSIEPQQGGMFSYKFVDDFQQEYLASSNQHKPEYLGELCTSASYKVVTAGKHLVRFVKFRDLKWNTDQVVDELIQTHNGKQMLKSVFRDRFAKEDCSLCQGNVKEDEYKETIVLDNGGVICKDCIKEGKHFTYGFGQ